MVARPDLRRLLLAGLLVLRLDDLRVVLEDVGQAVAGEDALPEVVGLESVRVGRVARAVVPALVERQEPGALALQVGAEAHLVVVHGEMRRRSGRTRRAARAGRGRAGTAGRRPRPSAWSGCSSARRWRPAGR